MSRYNEFFKLSVHDIYLIEQAVREQINHLSIPGSDEQLPGQENSYRKIRELMSLLGSLHNQKIFYSQVHPRMGVPLG